MLQLPAGREASRCERAPQYERHRPEQTLLYQLIEEYYPAFEAQWAAEGRVLPDYVRQEFDEYLKCGRLEHGFLRVQSDTCHAEHLVAFSWPFLRIHAPAALVIPFTSQTQGLLPQLRGTSHGSKCYLAR